jgi:hypothetical protein
MQYPIPIGQDKSAFIPSPATSIITAGSLQWNKADIPAGPTQDVHAIPDLSFPVKAGTSYRLFVGIYAINIAGAGGITIHAHIPAAAMAVSYVWQNAVQTDPGTMVLPFPTLDANVAIGKSNLYYDILLGNVVADGSVDWSFSVTTINDRWTLRAGSYIRAVTLLGPVVGG